VATLIVRERKKRELDPILRLLEQMEHIEGDKKDKHVQQFTDTVAGIKKFGLQADKFLEVIVKAEEKWLFSILLKVAK
jgi:hypothetical protein